jgi:hypothetical protein
LALTIDAFKLNHDPDNGFCTIGTGSLGGKAQGLVLLDGLLRNNKPLAQAYPEVQIAIPPTLIIAGDAFDLFMQTNHLDPLRFADLTDEETVRQVSKGRIPTGVQQSLARYLAKANYPLAVRSSGLLEDAEHHAYAGLYSTYMLSNDQAGKGQRLDRLEQAIKLVYAATFFKGPRAYAKRVGHDIRNDCMAVIVQQVAGAQRGPYCYPDISGVIQSINYYPLAGIQAEDGMATIALGLGRQVVCGGRALRFSPRYPQRLPQSSTVEEVLAYAQRRFYALQMGGDAPLAVEEGKNLVRREVDSALDELPLTALASTYVLAEHRIRDNVQIPGTRVLTFAGVLKYDLFPLAGLLRDCLALGQAALDVPVEMEFAVNLASDQQPRAQFYLLQMRPMTAGVQGARVTICADERPQAFCYTCHAMGNGNQALSDIVYVKPDAFDPAQTRAIAAQVAHINARLEQRQRNYLLIGPGRWGSADPWLGIPVRWDDISQAGAIVETASEKLKAEPSQGAHFFHNLAALGVSYLGVTQRAPDRLDWPWLLAQSKRFETNHVAHVRLVKPLQIKVDGRTSRGVIIK